MMEAKFLAGAGFKLQKEYARLRSSPLAARVASGAAWSFVSAALSRGAALFSSVVAARLLGKQGFGEFAIIQSTLQMCSVFAGFGIGMSVTKHIATLRQTDPDRAGRVLALSSVAAWITGAIMLFAVVAFSEGIAAALLGNVMLQRPLVAGAALLLFGAVNAVQMGALTGFEAFQTMAKINAVCGLLLLPFVWLGTSLFGVMGGVLALVANQAVSCAVNYYAIRSEAKRFGIKVEYAGCTRELRLLTSISVPTLFASMISVPANWFGNALLVRQPDGLGAMGLLTAVNQWRALITFIPNSLLGSSLPVLANRYAANDLKSCRRVFFFNVGVNVIFVCVTGILLYVCSDVVLAIYGREFVAGKQLVGWIVVICVLDAFSNAVGHVLISVGRIWTYFLLLLTWAVAYIAVGALLIPKHLAFGSVAATLSAQCVYTLCILCAVVVWVRRCR